MRDCTDEKVLRLAKIKKKIVTGFPNPVSRKKIVAWIELNIGLSKKKANSYIDTLVEANSWVEDENDGTIKSE